MITVEKLYKELDKIIPRSLSCEWDNDGLMLSPDLYKTVSRVVVTLDVTDDAVKYAAEQGAELIISHHPLIFKPIRSLVSEKLITLINNKISVFSFHTRLDSLEGGVNSALAAQLGIRNAVPLSDELGLIGDAHAQISVNEYADYVCKALGATCVNYIPSDKTVKRVAVIGGSGKDYVYDTIATGADIFVTGESGYHAMCDAADMGMYVIEAGHYETEQPVCNTLSEIIRKIDPELEISVFECGRIIHYGV